MIATFLDALNQVFSEKWLIQHLTSNDFLVAGIFAGLAYVLRSVPKAIFHFIDRQISIEIRITNEDCAYDDIVKFIESRRLKWFSRTYSKSLNDVYDDSEDTRLTVGYGRSWIAINGVLGYIVREFKDSNHSNSLKEEIFLKLYTRNSEMITTILERAIAENKKDADTFLVRTPSMDGGWSRAAMPPMRNFDGVYIEEGQKTIIKETIDHFLASKSWYHERGIPYKLGFFIEGEPGTGKSSVVNAICSYVNGQMFFVTNTALNGVQASELFSGLIHYTESKRKVLVFEDFDTFDSVEVREKDNKPEKSNMSLVLNVLDGSLTPDGIITICTTNHPENIDPAIKRPGRFDVVLKIGRLSFENFCKMVSKLYEIDLEIVSRDFEGGYAPKTGAEVQTMFIQERDYEKAKFLLRDGK